MNLSQLAFHADGNKERNKEQADLTDLEAEFYWMRIRSGGPGRTLHLYSNRPARFIVSRALELCSLNRSPSFAPSRVKIYSERDCRIHGATVVLERTFPARGWFSKSGDQPS